VSTLIRRRYSKQKSEIKKRREGVTMERGDVLTIPITKGIGREEDREAERPRQNQEKSMFNQNSKTIGAQRFTAGG